jgi:WhiB family redox-sensing transcriptional regulator
MTTPKKPTATGGNRGNYDYQQLMSEFGLLMRQFDWMDDAACRGRTDVEFFPEVGYNGKAPKALALCNNCPVKDDCLDFALENNIEHGIWGGTNPRQRKQLRRTLNKGTVVL